MLHHEIAAADFGTRPVATGDVAACLAHVVPVGRDASGGSAPYTNLPYFLLDVETDTAVAYGALFVRSTARQRSLPMRPVSVVCCTHIATLIALWRAHHHDIADGMRDVFAQGLAWGLADRDGVCGTRIETLALPYGLYWGAVTPTDEILADVREQSRLSYAAAERAACRMGRAGRAAR